LKPAIKSKIAFRAADLLNTQYKGWLVDRLAINVEKRLLKLGLDMILDTLVNRPGK
jgi:hypothetical protein